MGSLDLGVGGIHWGPWSETSTAATVLLVLIVLHYAYERRTLAAAAKDATELIGKHKLAAPDSPLLPQQTAGPVWCGVELSKKRVAEMAEVLGLCAWTPGRQPTCMAPSRDVERACFLNTRSRFWRRLRSTGGPRAQVDAPVQRDARLRQRVDPRQPLPARRDAHRDPAGGPGARAGSRIAARGPDRSRGRGEGIDGGNVAAPSRRHRGGTDGSTATRRRRSAPRSRTFASTAAAGRSRPRGCRPQPTRRRSCRCPCASARTSGAPTRRPEAASEISARVRFG